MPFPVPLYQKNAIARASFHDSGRLVPNAIDDRARLDPNSIWASTARSSDPKDGFRDITYRQYADAIDRTALLLERFLGTEHVGETIGYIGASDLRYPILTIAAAKVDMKVFCQHREFLVFC